MKAKDDPALATLEPADWPDSGRRRRSIWAAVWPGLSAIALVLVIWEAVVLTGWKPEYVLPPPTTVLAELGGFLLDSKFWLAVSITLLRALVGFSLALAIGTGLGIAVSASRVLRAALGSLLTGMQTMPSIAWFPFAILLFGLTENAIGFVVVLGAAPSIANGLISGIDNVPPPLLRTAKVLGARGLTLYRYVILPSALPTYVAGLKQGWAFAWRSLMAGELLVIIANRPSLGVQLQYFREFANAPALIAMMIVILVLGMAFDAVFSRLAAVVRRNRGLGETRL
ncbi:MAG: ABC transporter permease [Propionibacteriaceae bacterium]|jgi:NitT/TauT family transport system permease protein|nr:ABC transporter permease [Propionibacteriaceae bacterium]